MHVINIETCPHKWDVTERKTNLNLLIVYNEKELNF